MGWILTNSISKAQFVMQRHQEFARLHQKQQPYQPQKQQYRGRGQNAQQQQSHFGANRCHPHQGWLWKSGAENVEQVNGRTFCDTRPIPTPNTTSYYSTLYGEEDDEEDKTIIHSNCKYNITAQTDPLTDDSSIDSIEYPKRETLFNTSRIKLKSTKPLHMQEQQGILFSQEPT